MYIAILVALMIMALIEIKLDKIKITSILRYLSLGMLIILVCFRFDIQDYWGYFTNYYSFDDHSEYGFLIFSQLFRFFNIDFRFFVITIGLISVLGVYRGIRKYSPYVILSFTIAFHTIVLTYFLSGIRQGMACGLFIGFMLEYILEKKWIKYYILCPILGLIHSASWILIIIPVILLLSIKFYKYLIILSVTIGMANFFIGTKIIHIFNTVGSFAWYEFDKEISPSWFGILERVFMCSIITYLYYYIKEETSEKEEILYKIYLIGFMISAVFAPWAMLCSRVPALIKTVEIILIPIFLQRYDSKKRIFFIFILFVYIAVMAIKNLELYDLYTNAFTYPWYFAFTKEANTKIEDMLSRININSIDTVKDIFSKKVSPVYK